MEKSKYFKIYTAAHHNAIDLFKEGQLLFTHKHYPRAHALAFTALEEISKSQFAADVFTGLKTPEEFKNFFLDHKKKVGRVKWAHIDANSFMYNTKWVGPDLDDTKEINPKEPLFQKRLLSMYVDINFQDDKILEPKDEVKEADAEEILHIVEVALRRIWEVTEYWGHNIGTKGFMK